MKKGHLGFFGGFMLVATAMLASPGCSERTDSADGTGGQGGSGGQGVSATMCTDAVACGGDVVGSWNVASSCLALSGDMDVSLTSLACPTVPATGELQTSGTIVFNADGSYSDNTTTTGSVSFRLDSSCLAISGVPVECDRVGSIFAAMGWTTATCSAAADGACDCSLSAQQQAGLGQVLPYTDLTGQYTTMSNTLKASEAEYSYCVSGDSLTLIPQMAALSGSVVLNGSGTVASGGAGGTSGAGGAGGATGGAGGGGGSDAEPGTGPCDIYAAAGTPCAAAHSTIRALFGEYDGALYEVTRADGMTQDITLQTPGGFADSALQDAFCAGTSCTITKLYDQTGNGNFLEAQTPESSVGGFQGQTAANANQESLTVGGHQVYSLFTRPRQAYWNNGSQSGMPLGAEPQGVYMVTSGTHYNGGCCYNYGNGQLNRQYNGGPQMDAVYFGDNRIWGTGAGEGPWVMADMEDGMLSGGTPGAMNPNSLSLNFPYVTAMEKNDGTTNFALKGGDATQSTLTTMWEGPLPGSKRPMRKEGAIILGAGGDCCLTNNNLSEGTFYEGAVVAGYPSDETDEAIHANIVEAGYGQ